MIKRGGNGSVSKTYPDPVLNRMAAFLGSSVQVDNFLGPVGVQRERQKRGDIFIPAVNLCQYGGWAETNLVHIC